MKKTCIIAGSGPSLLTENIDLIPDNVYFMVCNHYYKMNDSYTRKPDAIVITDSYRLNEIGDKYSNYDAELFVGHQKYINPPVKYIKNIVRRSFTPVSQLAKSRIRKLFFFDKILIPQFLHDLFFDKRKWNHNNISQIGINYGSSVIFAATQIAISKGYNKIIYIGVDANYSNGNYSFKIDENFFLNQSFMSNPRLNMEPYLVSMQIYYEPFGIEFVDCTNGGKLQFIKKSSLEIEFANEN
ncbi:hypothetical protein [Flavobacterium sp. HJJ]|uniref:hypothetical protein n=1 Tax=Flavobacterium sp. HJJ TaxID=2783792 RepID=UPI00188CEACA|nr:hypothetical protein [Flavobacterium sp. HJJ]MBF4470429.1 hypothetical protein [Flavobacterium sp. HJJ]